MTKLSNTSILVLITFICAALMTSLFIYRNTHTTQAVTLSHATLFTVPREIKPFKLVSHDAVFTQQQLNGHWSLVVFGFTRCSRVCPSILNTLAHAYPSLKNQLPNLQVVFISIDPERDDSQTLNRYVQAFNPAFISASGDLKSLHALQAQLGIYSEKMAHNGQFQHTPSILLFNPSGQWVGIYKHDMNRDQLIATVANSIRTLTASG